MKDFIDYLKYYGLTARIKRLSDNLNTEARKIYHYLGYDIEPNWHLIFLLLKKEEELSVTEIANRLKLSHPAIVKIIKRMKELDYVVSFQDKNDSRKHLLSLSSKSKEKLPQFEIEWKKIQDIVKEYANDDFLDNIQYFEFDLTG